MADKVRLDKRLLELRLFPSRQQAQAAIMAGKVWVNGQRETKAGRLVDDRCEIEVRGNDQPYVSRGGLKLAKALQMFRVDVAGKTALDIGASTGGFTDCLLKHGAVKVYAVDVGYGQLDWNLRHDPRVVNLERHNIRTLPEELIAEPVDLCTVDVSFISIAKVLQPAIKFLKESADVITLIKPQFEAGPQNVGKGGIVRNPAIHVQVLREVFVQLDSLGFVLCGLSFSPIRGGHGNIEFLAHWRLSDHGSVGEGDLAAWVPIMEEVVDQAHESLEK